MITLQKLLLPVPTMIEEAFGYTGSSRFVAFYWKPSPFGFCWHDPHYNTSSSHWAVWIAFTQPGYIDSSIGSVFINMEVGLLRRILKKHKQWARLADDVKMLPEKPKPARVMSPEEKAILLKTAQTRTDWDIARCAAIVALNTTMRGCELKGLRRKDVDLFEKTLTIQRGSTKTDAGNRVIPLNQDAVLALSELLARAELLGASEPGHFIFPACESGVIDPTKPMKGWRSAWRSLTKAAGLRGLRFHDLRHQAITELCEAGLSDMTIMGITGHVSREMLMHYSHIRMKAKREAVAMLETALPVASTPEENNEAVRLN